MKGYKLIKPFFLEEQDITENTINTTSSKIKITKSLITLSDILRYSGEIETNNLVLGSSGIGIITETDSNLFDIEKGSHIYVEPNRECEECFNCKNEEYSKCVNVKTACEDFDGFLSDFFISPTDKIFALPESVSDLDALFIDHISRALAVIDKLNVNKGDYVSIVGGNNFGNILAQLLIYYQAVPIVLTTDKEEYDAAKNSGIYYVIGENDNWTKEVSLITSGRMTSKVVYISDSDVAVFKAFSLASQKAMVVFTGSGGKTSPVSFGTAIKKQLEIICINNGFGNTSTAINLLATKALKLNNLILETENYENVIEVFKKLYDKYNKDGVFHETIIKQF